MKHINLYITVATAACLLASLTLSGCGVSKEISTEQRKHIDFGLVITTEQDRDSRILWFDKDLNLQQEQQYSYAKLGTHFTSPADVDNKLYVAVGDLMKKDDVHKVISIDKDSLTPKEYPTEKGGLNSISVMNNRIYAISGYGYFESVDMTTNEHNVIKMSRALSYSIIATDKKVFVFSSDQIPSGDLNAETTFWVDIYTPEFKLLESRDMTRYGAVTNKYCEDSEYLYLTGAYDADDQSTHKIIRLNKKTYEMSEWEIPGSQEPFNDIYRYKDGFLVTHYDPVSNDGNKISLIDNEGKVTHTAFIERFATVTGILDDHLIVADGEYVQSYSLPDLQLIKKQPYTIEKKSNIFTSQTHQYYLSALLMVGKPKS